MSAAVEVSCRRCRIFESQSTVLHSVRKRVSDLYLAVAEMSARHGRGRDPVLVHSYY